MRPNSDGIPVPDDPHREAFLILLGMQELKKSVSLIYERARRELAISRDDYALCDYALYRSADPRSKRPGWCCDTKEDVADFIGISRPGLYKMMDRMAGKGLLEIDAASGFFRATAHFIDTQEGRRADVERKQSLQPTVNKVYNGCKQSLQPTVNKVTPQYRGIVRVKEDKYERDKSRETALPLSAGPSESENPHSEPKEKKAPLIAPHPPFLPTPPPPDFPAPAGPLVAVVFAPPTVEHIPTPDGPSFRVETHPPAEVKTIRQTRQKPVLQKKTVEIPATHAEISPLLNELLEKRPYLQKSHDALRREMEWFFSKPVAFCREHIQCSLDRSSGVWDSLKFSGVEETFLRWQRTQERMATPAQQAGPARPQQFSPSPIAGERRL